MAARSPQSDSSTTISTEKATAPIARTAYYDRIAKQWHRVTGHHGGPLKRYVLNDRILSAIDGIAGRALLELGAGNGYFLPLLLRRFSGQTPSRIVITDQSPALLEIAQATFRMPAAEYLPLDVQVPFPFGDETFDLILASMLFNELPTSYLQHALAECQRVLRNDGRLIAAVPHPAFVHALARKGALTDFGRGLFAMPSAEGLRLPVSRRSVEAYTTAMAGCGFQVAAEDVYADDNVLHAKTVLGPARKVPLALLFTCSKDSKAVAAPTT